MHEILYRYKEYEIEYNRGLGIITVNKKIPVDKFIELRLMLMRTGNPVNDIRVETDKTKRWDYWKITMTNKWTWT